jgi:hypothetical protein
MQLNKKRILGDAVEHYKGKFNGDKSYGMAEECVDWGQRWVYTYREDYSILMTKSPREMRRELRKYVKSRVSYSDHRAMFLPSFIWVTIAQAIISWIVGKIIDNILEQRDGGGYLTDEEET